MNSGDHESAIWEIEAFLKNLSSVKVLDPSCGSGNFLSVALYMMKDLEGEVASALRSLGRTDMDITRRGYMVGPNQFYGIEISPHAVAISELVVWITFLQKHYKVYGNVPPPEPIFHDYGNIECRDAVLAWDTSVDSSTDPRYKNARPADPWPEANFIVGNPPFLGSPVMRRALGDSYVDNLRSSYPEIPDSSDYVMYWWHRAAELVRAGKVRRFGFISPSSIKQMNGGKVVHYHMKQKPPLNIIFAIPDHPWIGPNVKEGRLRVAMTVGALGNDVGTLSKVILERPQDDFVRVDLSSQRGKINADLSIGMDTKLLQKLMSNSGLCSQGMKLIGKGFLVKPNEAEKLGLGDNPDLANHIRPYRNGKDIADISRNLMVIDLYGVPLEKVRLGFPKIYQHLIDKVKPERENNKDKNVREIWWVFGRPRIELRKALIGLPRYIATPETSRRRYFVFLDSDIVPDNKLVCIASDDAYILGILSSRIHVEWTLAVGGRHGIGNDPVYVKTQCFDTFPFPTPSPEQRERIADIAEKIDAHRKERQSQHPELTLSKMYGVLNLLNHGVYLESNDQKLCDEADLVRLKHLHDELDFAVAAAYGWPHDLDIEEILEKLLSLNQKRAEEEKNGIVKWLREDYQDRYNQPFLRTEVAEGDEVK